MRGEQAIFNLEIKKKSWLSINPDIHLSKVFSSGSPFNLANFHIAVTLLLFGILSNQNKNVLLNTMKIHNCNTQKCAN